GQLRRQTSDPTQRLAVLPVELLAVRVGGIARAVLQGERGRAEEGIAIRPRVGGSQHAVDRIRRSGLLGLNFSHWVNPSLPYFGKFLSMADEHYFSQAPASALQLRPLHVSL